MIALKIDNGDCNIEFVPENECLNIYASHHDQSLVCVSIEKDELSELIEFLQKRLSEME